MSTRKTKVIATVGPACESESVLQELVQTGVDIFRINTSHSSESDLITWFSTLRNLRKKSKRKIQILMDLQGPRVRTGLLAKPGRLELKEGAEVVIHLNDDRAPKGSLSTSCALFSHLIKARDPILIDNGLIELRVLQATQAQVNCVVISGGMLGENKGINLPNAPVRLPTLTEHDRAALKIAAPFKVDYVALSFVRSQYDVLTVKQLMADLKFKSPIISKIEKPVALKHLDEIFLVSEGIMIARGDLGIELGVEKVPVIQKKLILRANKIGKFIITATQMLESMMEHPRPTRAEVSDVANSVLDGTSAVMLSGETSIGKYPLEAVRMMIKIIKEAERYFKIG